MFDPERDSQRALGNLEYVLRCNAALKRIPHAVALTYEALCDPALNDEALVFLRGKSVLMIHGLLHMAAVMSRIGMSSTVSSRKDLRGLRMNFCKFVFSGCHFNSKPDK